MGHGLRGPPVPPRQGLHGLQVPPADPQQRLPRLDLRRPRPSEERAKIAQGPRADQVQRCDLLAQLLKAADQHPGVVKSKLTNDFRKERGLLDVRFDQEDVPARTQNLDGQAREATPGTNVGQPTLSTGCSVAPYMDSQK